jgi:uncharacterized membrane protein
VPENVDHELDPVAPDAAVLSADEADEEDEGDWAEAPTVRRWWSVTAFVLSLLGLGEAAYLTYEHFTQGLPSCPATGIIDCAKVTTSPESYVFHVPVALLGLLFFAGMVVVNFPPLWRLRYAWLAWLRLGMVVTGLGMVIYLVSAEVFRIKAICLWCTGVHVITVAMFVLIVATFPTVLAAARARAWAEAAVDDEVES